MFSKVGKVDYEAVVDNYYFCMVFDPRCLSWFISKFRYNITTKRNLRRRRQATFIYINVIYLHLIKCMICVKHRDAYVIFFLYTYLLFYISKYLNLFFNFVNGVKGFKFFG